MGHQKPKAKAKPKKRSIFAPIKRRGPGSGNRNTDKLLKRLERIENPRRKR